MFLFAGSMSDGGVWSNTDFMQALEERTITLPPPTPLPNTNEPFPYVFIADEAFPLSTYMMRPFPKKNRRMTGNERIFNYRLSRARRVIENTFGIMGTKWQILSSRISCSPEHSEQIIKALVCLHNFMMTCGRVAYCPPGFADIDHNGEIQRGAWRAEINQINFHNLNRVGANRSARIAYKMRNYLMQYFVSEIGQQQAPWQYEKALRGHIINLPPN